MPKKNILFVTSSFTVKSNSATIRNNSLCRGLKAIGHEVDVLTVSWPANMRSAYFLDEQNGNLIESKLPSINILQKFQASKTIKRSFFPSIIKNMIRDILFFPDICKDWPKQGLKDINDIAKYDLIISSSDSKSSHFMGLALKKNYKNIPYIQIWGDPWYDDMSLSCFLKPLAKYHERRLLRSADAVFYVSPITLSKQKRLFADNAHKMYFCPRSYYKAINVTKKSNTFRILYPGSLGYGRNFEWFAQMVENYNQTYKKQITIVVYSNEKWRKPLSQWKCIEFHESQDFPVILEEYSKTNALLFLENAGTTGQIPGKLFDYFGTNLPIVSILNDSNGPLAEMLTKYNRCVTWIMRDTNNGIEQSLMAQIFEKCNQKFEPLSEYSPTTAANVILQECKFS